MYIEVFLLDNLLMDALILRVACALSARPCLFFRVLLFALAGTLYAYLSLYWSFLQLWPWKLLCGGCMAFALPNGGRLRAYFSAWASVVLSAAILGGMISMLVFAAQEANGAYSASYRTALFGAGVAAFLPDALKRRRPPPAQRYRLCIAAGGKVYCVPACLDTGNTLRESVSGKPVIVADIPELLSCAHIPVSLVTVRGAGVLYALRADMVTLDGIPTDALVAISSEKLENALVPPGAVSTL